MSAADIVGPVFRHSGQRRPPTSDKLADIHADVGGQRWPECRKTGPTMSADDTHWHSGRRRRLTSAADVGLSVGKLDRQCQQPTLAWMSASWTDVGGRHWSKGRKTRLKNVGSRHPPSCRSCSPHTSLVILCNFSLYVAVHFNSPLCNSSYLTAYYPFAPTHRWFLPFNEFLLKRFVQYPRLKPVTSLSQSWRSTTWGHAYLVQVVPCFNIYRCVSSQQFSKWVSVPSTYLWSS